MSGVCANCGDVLYCAECHEPKQATPLSAGVGLLSDSEFIQDMQTYKIDHEPNGWPAVQQWKVDRLIDIIFKMTDNDDGRLTVHILRNWDREKTVRFAKHLLGDKCQVCRDR